MSAFQINFRVNVQGKRRASAADAPATSTGTNAIAPAPDSAVPNGEAALKEMQDERPRGGAEVTAGEGLARVIAQLIPEENSAAVSNGAAAEATKARPANGGNASAASPALAQAAANKGDNTPDTPSLLKGGTIIWGTIDWDPEFSPRTIIALILIGLIIAAYLVVSGRLKGENDSAAKHVKPKGVDRFCNTEKLDRLDELGMVRAERPLTDDKAFPSSSSSTPKFAVSFRAAKLPNVGSSFAIPLTTIYECKADRLSFDVVAEQGCPLQVGYNVVMTRIGPGGAWAKVEVCATGGLDALSVPIASCHLAEGGDEVVEGYNIQGALLSWQSLLMQEKHAADAGAGGGQCADAGAGGAPKARPPPPRVPASVQSRVTNARRGLPMLELRDSFGRCNGQLRPGEGVQYDLWQEGERTLTIERSPDTHWIAASRDGKEKALATVLPGSKPSDQPEEFLQVDLEALSCGNAEEPALLLLCILAAVTFGTPFTRPGAQNFQ